jgi:hypothetical protein
LEWRLEERWRREHEFRCNDAICIDVYYITKESLLFTGLALGHTEAVVGKGRVRGGTL